MKVLKEGIKPTKSEKKAQKEYIKKCRNCKCVFTYQKRDMHMAYDEWNWVDCPCCHHYCNIIIPKRYRGNNEKIRD